MKNISFLRMLAAGLTVWLGLSVGVANAVTSISPFSGNTYAGYSAIFGNNDVSSPFSDAFNFSLPADASGDGASNVISLSGTNLIFTAFDLFEASLGNIVGTITGDTASLSFVNGAAPGNYTLTVAGYKTNPALTSSYAGNINISPVPEPEMFGMLMAGLALVGFTARRRKSSNFA